MCKERQRRISKNIQNVVALSLAVSACTMIGACERRLPAEPDRHAQQDRVLCDYIAKHQASFRPSVTLKRSGVPVPGLFEISAHCVYGGPNQFGGTKGHENTLLLRARLLEVTPKGVFRIWGSESPTPEPTSGSSRAAAHTVARILESGANATSISMLERSQDRFWRFEWTDTNPALRPAHLRFVIDGVVVRPSSPWTGAEFASRAAAIGTPGVAVYDASAAIRMAASRDIGAAGMEAGAYTVRNSVDLYSRDDEYYLYDNLNKTGR